MTRREFVGVTAAAAGEVLAGGSARGTAPPRERTAGQHYMNTTIRDYLSEQARQITDRALGDLTDAEAFHRLLPERRRRYMEMMGLADFGPPDSRPSLDATVTGVVERHGYRIEKLHYQSLPGLYVTANLYLPTPSAEHRSPFPGVLYVCGHAEKQKVHYQAHPRQFAELGFAALIVETVALGEAPGNHHGCYREGWFHWYSRGYSPAAVEMLNGIRGLDLLSARPEVDGTRLGVTGISGGGASTWWIAAGDERVKAAAPVCGTSTLESQIYDRTIDGHCDCMFWPNLFGWDLADVGALIAPRPLLIASADRDGIFTIAAIRKVHGQLAPLYRKLDASDHLRLVETPGPHSYHARSRTAIFSWFARHLQGREIPPEQIGDIDESPQKQETEATLRVFVNGAPSKNRAVTIQDELVRLAEPPRITDRDSLGRERSRVVAELKRITFHAFPADPPPLDVKLEYEHAESGPISGRFAFTSEAGWRLHGQLIHAPAGQRLPVLVALRSPGEARGATESFIGRLPSKGARVIVEPRGTGDTAWGEELNWHLRRSSAWIGRTLASMRVWDALRGIEAVGQLPGVDGAQVALAARGEMAVIALYAALLNGHVAELYLDSPPATQNSPSNPDGRGPAIEMMGCLRVTDLPQVAGLLFPCEIAASGEIPATYAWAEDLYRALGAPDRFRRA